MAAVVPVSRTGSRAVGSSTRLSKTQAFFTSGREFYDDGYNDAEMDAVIDDKLNFDALPVIERDEELQLLCRAYTNSVASSRTGGIIGRSATKHNKPDRVLPLALIWGPSGTGKTRLVQKFIDDLCDDCIIQNNSTKQAAKQATSDLNQDSAQRAANEHASAQGSTPAYLPPYFIQGKYDQQTSKSDPFTAIIQALTSFCDQVCKSSDAERDRIRMSLLEALGSQASVITTLVPAIRQVLEPRAAWMIPTTPEQLAFVEQDPSPSRQSQGSSSRCTGHSDSDTKTMWNELQYTFVALIRAVSTKRRPVILFLDDLQWASQISLDLVSTLLSDTNLRHFFMIGTVRQKVNPHFTAEPMKLEFSTPLSSMIRSLQPDHPKLSQGHFDSDGAETCHLHSRQQQQQLSSPAAQWTDITIRNLSRQGIAKCLSALLDRSTDDMPKLVDKVYTKSEGNIFFALQMVDQLQRSGILAYSRITFQWELNSLDGASTDSGRSGGNDNNDDDGGGDDDNNIASQAPHPAGGIIELMTMKIRQLPAQVQRPLIVAAYIRSSFDLPTLHAVLKAVHSQPASTSSQELLSGMPLSLEQLSTMLEQAVLEGMLANSIGGSKYRFAHDRIQQAAYEMVPFGEDRTKLRVCIGRYLYACYRLAYFNAGTGTDTGGGTDTDSNIGTDDNATEAGMHMEGCVEGCTEGYVEGSDHAFDKTLLFMAAEHLNSAPTKDHTYAARMNLQAGKLAAEMAALDQASAYLQLASNALKKVQDPWRHHYQTTLELHTERADIELALGRYSLGYELSERVLRHARSLDEKLSTYASMANALGREDKHWESLLLSQQVAQMFGCYPKRGYVFHIAAAMVKVRRYFKRNSDEAILGQPVATDPRAIASMRFLREQLVRSYMCSSTLHFLLPTLKIILLSAKHGLTDNAGLSYCTYSLLMNSLGDQQNAMRFIYLAHKIMGRCQNPLLEGHVTATAALYINTWSEPAGPPHNALGPCHKSSMQRGDFEGAFFCWMSSGFLVQSEGYPLASSVQSQEDCLEQMRLYKVSSGIRVVEHSIRLSNWLMGIEPVCWDEIAAIRLAPTQVDPKDRLEVCMEFFVAIEMAVVSRRYEVAEPIFARFWPLAANIPLYFMTTQGLMFDGITMAARYRQTRRHKYLRALRKTRQKMKTICDTRGYSGLNRSLIIKAELYSVSKSVNNRDCFRRVQTAYDEAITVSVQNGHTHEAGLACELAGEYALSNASHCSSCNIVDYFSRSYAYYREWGALLKLEELKERRGAYIDEDMYCAMGSSEDGRPSGVIEGMSARKTVLPKFDYERHFALLSSSSLESASTDTEPATILVGETKSSNFDLSTPSRTEDWKGSQEGDNISLLTDSS